MQEDIKKELLIISKQVEGVGRGIRSTKIDIEGLLLLAEALKLHRKTILTYVKMEKKRLKEL